MAFSDDDQDTTFEQIYRCYPVSFIEKSNLEKGDKIIMPPSALDRLASLHIDYPMLFQLSNPSAGKVTHCGVLEFVSDEGIIYIPYWMMENMLLQEGDTVCVRNTSLAKGTYVKLQPHTKDFLDITNPKAILETSLRNYSCLTTGDTIMVAYNSKKYYIDIVETKPSPAVSIIETDCEVDFAAPLDYKEPEKPAPCALSKRKRSEVEDDEPPTTKVPQFSPFTGSGRRLDGKPSSSTQSADQTSSPKKKQKQSNDETEGSDSKSLNTTSRRHSGKLVFGSNAAKFDTQRPLPKASENITKQDSSQKQEAPKFQAFTGKKYSLNS
ncbi:hypothetical protein HN51_042829 [Arachis hypogaea]|uniref:ubiquitin fusion degradation protein 1 homolog n=1 Tax=Arachis ipaensis TaxID=130454 RepID=UPI0007AF04A5|nr:ubiquitin fusion degradation protein 1 homolog [Arachis ipaensis]XP_016169450.1 ubiquitin fusion degradation protein 1 homolog [Arachis ipaensis]XP_025671453.1 ubiquitin recognition factor in ER-associated degradation protein 1 [Arachis hypogaea]XP_025671454.1 ubiquitin recognition factor in ER-associated degradation protein 1 [Arachis hypogaea]XP_025671455.1 ubiquitin recognition factor in ER-associated degradation protein 1 [Arachis hypogaea]QHN94983.1 uncharacterized protein DS421_18g605